MVLILVSKTKKHIAKTTIYFTSIISDEVDCVKQTALHYSMTNTRWGVMETLVKAGANINKRRMKDGWTPIYVAAIFGYSYKVQYLVDNGADVLLCDDRGWSVMDWVARYSLHVVSGVLKQAPRTVTEMSGKKYVEKENDDKLDVPVEYDEGINKLLAKLEVKRKAKIEEHRKLMMKMEQEKNMDRMRLEEKVVEKSSGENQEILGLATQNIMNRQKRMILEMEKKDETNCDAINEKTSSFKASIDELFAKTAELENIEHSKKSEEEHLSYQSLSDDATKIKNVKDECDTLYANSDICDEYESRTCESGSEISSKTIEARESAIKSANIKPIEASEGAVKSVNNKEILEMESIGTSKGLGLNISEETKTSCKIIPPSEENFDKELKNNEKQVLTDCIILKSKDANISNNNANKKEPIQEYYDKLKLCQKKDLSERSTEIADLSLKSSGNNSLVVTNVHEIIKNSEKDTQKPQVTSTKTNRKDLRRELKKKSETQSCTSNSKLQSNENEDIVKKANENLCKKDIVYIAESTNISLEIDNNVEVSPSVSKEDSKRSIESLDKTEPMEEILSKSDEGFDISKLRDEKFNDDQSMEIVEKTVNDKLIEKVEESTGTLMKSINKPTEKNDKSKGRQNNTAKNIGISETINEIPQKDDDIPHSYVVTPATEQRNKQEDGLDQISEILIQENAKNGKNISLEEEDKKHATNMISENLKPLPPKASEAESKGSITKRAKDLKNENEKQGNLKPDASLKAEKMDTIDTSTSQLNKENSNSESLSLRRKSEKRDNFTAKKTIPEMESLKIGGVIDILIGDSELKVLEGGQSVESKNTVETDKDDFNISSELETHSRGELQAADLKAQQNANTKSSKKDVKRTVTIKSKESESDQKKEKKSINNFLQIDSQSIHMKSKQKEETKLVQNETKKSIEINGIESKSTEFPTDQDIAPSRTTELNDVEFYSQEINSEAKLKTNLLDESKEASEMKCDKLQYIDIKDSQTIDGKLSNDKSNQSKELRTGELIDLKILQNINIELQSAEIKCEPKSSYALKESTDVKHTESHSVDLKSKENVQTNLTNSKSDGSKEQKPLETNFEVLKFEAATKLPGSPPNKIPEKTEELLNLKDQQNIEAESWSAELKSEPTLPNALEESTELKQVESQSKELKSIQKAETNSINNNIDISTESKPFELQSISLKSETNINSLLNTDITEATTESKTGESKSTEMKIEQTIETKSQCTKQKLKQEIETIPIKSDPLEKSELELLKSQSKELKSDVTKASAKLVMDDPESTDLKTELNIDRNPVDSSLKNTEELKPLTSQLTNSKSNKNGDTKSIEENDLKETSQSKSDKNTITSDSRKTEVLKSSFKLKCDQSIEKLNSPNDVVKCLISGGNAEPKPMIATLKGEVEIKIDESHPNEMKSENSVINDNTANTEGQQDLKTEQKLKTNSNGTTEVRESNQKSEISVKKSIEPSELQQDILYRTSQENVPKCERSCANDQDSMVKITVEENIQLSNSTTEEPIQKSEISAKKSIETSDLQEDILDTKLQQNGPKCENNNSFDEDSKVKITIEEKIQLSPLPDHINDSEFTNKLKVYNNYRTFGAMYYSRNNFKKAEWAFKNGIKQSTSCEAQSKEQLRTNLQAEIEFRLSRAR